MTQNADENRLTVANVLVGMQTLHLEPGDVLVVLVPKGSYLSGSAIEHILESAQRVFPENKVIVLEDGLTLARVTTETEHG